MNVPVHHCYRNPQIFSGEDKLFLEWHGVVGWQLDHSELGSLRGGLYVPVERTLAWPWLRELLHPLISLFVELDFEAKGFCYGRIRNIIVSVGIISVELGHRIPKTSDLRWSNATT